MFSSSEDNEFINSLYTFLLCEINDVIFTAKKKKTNLLLKSRTLDSFALYHI